MAERKAIPKMTRFEVFKRDSFSCQYCGAKAPDVVLHIDHIVPVSKGGDNDILNLTTACSGCNGGKSDRKLDDLSAVEKSRRQLDDLQERRNQLDLMIEWKMGLKEIEDDSLDAACDYYDRILTGWNINANGRGRLKRLLKRFGLADILTAMDDAEKRLRFTQDGSVEPESAHGFLSSIEYSANTNRKYNKDPIGKDVAYISAILRNRIHAFPPKEILANIRFAIERKFVQVSDLKTAAAGANSYTEFNRAIFEFCGVEYQEAVA